MNKLFKSIIFSTSIIVTSFSCKKFLDQDPISIATDQTTWKSEADANSAVAGCYSLIRAAFNTSVSYYAYGDLPTDEFNNVLGRTEYDNIRTINWGVSIASSNTYDARLKLRLYTPFYSAIQQSNRCLHFIANMSNDVFSGADDETREAQKDKYLAEAYFTRAFNYFYISRIWGDVPLDTTYQDDISGITSDPRIAQTIVLNKAKEDLNYAIEHLDWQDASSSDRAVRGDKGAALALLAHIYAWEGNYDSCAIACNSVINSGSYSLVAKSDYATLYNSITNESIFEISQNNTTEGISASAESLASLTLTNPYIPTITIPIWQLDTTKVRSLYADTNDIRFKNEFYSLISGTSNYIVSKKYSNIQTIKSNTANYYLSLNNIIVFRLADILLLKAEALAAGSSVDIAGAQNLVNDIRDRAGISKMVNLPSKLEMIDSITAERGRELFLEGARFYDLVRNERLTGVAKIPNITHNDFLKGKYYWPVDPSLFRNNSGLTQTPFWQQILTY